MVEDTQAEYDEATAALEQMESEWSTSQEHLHLEQDELVQRIKELNNHRKEQTGSISPQFLSAYDNTLKKGMGTAVVQLKNNRCRGCQVSVPANLAKAADEGKLVYCDNCGRILCPA